MVKDFRAPSKEYEARREETLRKRKIARMIEAAKEAENGQEEGS